MEDGIPRRKKVARRIEYTSISRLSQQNNYVDRFGYSLNGDTVLGTKLGLFFASIYESMNLTPPTHVDTQNNI